MEGSTRNAAAQTKLVQCTWFYKPIQ